MNFNPTLERGPGEECEATWWVQATPGTTYWRCLVPARHLPGQALEFAKEDLGMRDEETPYLPRQRGEAAIWQFLGDKNRSKIALGMKILHGTRTIMELDDNYLQAPPYLKNSRIKKPWQNTIAEAGEFGYSHEMHQLVVPQMDALIVSTEYMADIYSDYHDEIYVCPNSLDMDDWQYDREEPDGVLRIVYYGSISHAKDTPLITRAMKWAAKQPDVEVHTVGFNPPDWSFGHHAQPWYNSLEEARKALFRFDIGVAPLKGNPWSNGKSDVKVLEYAAAGILPVASDTIPYRDWESSGILVKDEDWEEVIRHHVLNREQVPLKAKVFQEEVLERRTIQSTIDTWKEAIHA